MDYAYLVGIPAAAQAVLTGFIVGIVYDVFRLLRRIWHFSAVSVAMQDILFWAGSAVYVFFACLESNAGYFRLYFAVLTLAGWLLYFFTAGKLVFFLLDRAVGGTRRIFNTIRQKCIRLLEKLYIKI